MEKSCVIGYGIVGKATAKGFGIKDYIDLEDGTITIRDAAKCQFVFLALPTPTVDGQCDTTTIRNYITGILAVGGNPIFVIRSTVIPGTARDIMEKTGARVVSNPEFLTESTWEREAEHPGLVVIGSDSEVGDSVDALYRGRWSGLQIYRTDTITAETIKYALNTFFATKVVFANSLYDYCQRVGVNYENVRKVLEYHPWGSKSHFEIWHKGGRGAGGKCLKKDLEAFTKASGSSLLKEVERINQTLLKDYPKEEK